jgi:hypothetical protein
MSCRRLPLSASVHRDPYRATSRKPFVLAGSGCQAQNKITRRGKDFSRLCVQVQQGRVPAIFCFVLLKRSLLQVKLRHPKVVAREWFS